MEAPLPPSAPTPLVISLELAHLVPGLDLTCAPDTCPNMKLDQPLDCLKRAHERLPLVVDDHKSLLGRVPDLGAPRPDSRTQSLDCLVPEDDRNVCSCNEEEEQEPLKTRPHDQKVDEGPDDETTVPPMAMDQNDDEVISKPFGGFLVHSVKISSRLWNKPVAMTSLCTSIHLPKATIDFSWSSSMDCNFLSQSDHFLLVQGWP